MYITIDVKLGSCKKHRAQYIKPDEYNAQYHYIDSYFIFYFLDFIIFCIERGGMQHDIG
jgi:hypothetical protein